MERADTIQELKDLKSSLSEFPAENVYTVPVGYFEGFAGIVLNRIKAMTANNSREELRLISPALESLSNQVPYSVPGGYFDTLPERIMAVINQHEDYQTAGEELSSLSPLLSSIGKQVSYSVPEGYFDALPGSVMSVIIRHEDYQTADEELSSLSPLLSSITKKTPYSVPEGYFKNFSTVINLSSDNKPVAKTVSMVNRKWFRFAAAAVVIGFIAFTGVSLFFSNGPAVSASNTHAWVEENMKKVSMDDINSFIQPAVAITSSKTTDVSELMKDISDKDIQNFLNEAPADDNSDDLLLN